MVRSTFPVYIEPSQNVSVRLGNQIPQMALFAVREILKNSRGLEVACQQILYRGHCYALSSRITANGDLVLTIDVGDPRLQDRLILETELRRAEREAREKDRKINEERRRLRRSPRRR